MPQSNRSAKAAGFEGSVAGLGLTDVIAMNAENRFSGCIAVECDISRGLVFLRDGEIVNAELDGKSGEEAFYEIMQWPSGSFSLEPNVATTRQTITRPWKFLLMEALRIGDERRTGRVPTPSSPPAASSPSAPSPAPAAPARPMGTAERVRQIPGVAVDVVLTKQGERVDGDGFEAEKLAGQTVYLTSIGARLGAIFGSGEMVAAVVQGTTQHLLHLASRKYDLSVLIDGDAQPGAVEAEIRRLLAPKR